MTPQLSPQAAANPTPAPSDPHAVASEGAQAASVEMRDAFMSSLMDQFLSLDDGFLVDGLPDKQSRYLLAMARANPSLRPNLAWATRTRRAKLHSSPRAAPSFVYFIQESSAGLIKIGAAGDPQRRLAALQTGSPHRLRLLGAVAGGLAEEQRLHSQFRMDRTSGEWFRPSVELTTYIGAMAR